jgi:muramidase (phage lysozyme)
MRMIQPYSSGAYMPAGLPALSSGDKDLDALLAKADTVAVLGNEALHSLPGSTEALSGLNHSIAKLSQASIAGSTSGLPATDTDALLRKQNEHLMQALATMKSGGSVSATYTNSASLGAKSANGVYFGKAAHAPASNFSHLTSTGKRMMEALKNPNVRAFLDALAVAELGKEGAAKGGYGKFFGDHGAEETFSNEQLAKGHPDQVRTRNGLTSSAIGRYQFLTTTWNETASKLGLKDMMPQAQELAAVALLEKRGILDEVQAGNFDAAFNEAGKEWASLEGNPYGQGTPEGSRVAFMSQIRNSLA